MKKIALAGLAILGLTQIASADTYFYITGSSAYAPATFSAITNLYSNSITAYAYDKSTLAGSKIAVFKGTFPGITGTTIIKTKFNGSELGIQSVKKSNSITGFLADSAATSASGSTATSPTESLIPHACMSDTFDGTSRFANGATVLVNGVSTTYGTISTPTITGSSNGIVGIIPFKFIATSDSDTKGVTNLTSRQALDLWSAGKIPLSEWTGVSTDTNKFVYATGRDIDSGTRLTCMSAIGLAANASVIQNFPRVGASGTGYLATANVGTTGNTVITTLPVTVNGVSQTAGNSGYTSGGDMAKALANPSTAFGGTTGVAAIIGYNGVLDADPQMINATAPLKEIAFNGVTLGSANGDYTTNTKLTYGQWPVWSYEHMYVGNATSGDQLTIANTIAQKLYDTLSPVKVSDMKVSRSGDGGTILQK